MIGQLREIVAIAAFKPGRNEDFEERPLSITPLHRGRGGNDSPEFPAFVVQFAHARHGAEKALHRSRRMPDHSRLTVSAGTNSPRSGATRASSLSACTLDNLAAVLAGVGMDLADILRLTTHTTDMNLALQNFDLMGQRMGAAGNAPQMTLLETIESTDVSPCLLRSFDPCLRVGATDGGKDLRPCGLDVSIHAPGWGRP